MKTKYPGGNARSTPGREINRLTKLLRFVVKNNIQAGNKTRLKGANKKKREEEEENGEEEEDNEEEEEDEDEEEDDEDDEEEEEDRRSSYKLSRKDRAYVGAITAAGARKGF